MVNVFLPPDIGPGVSRSSRAGHREPASSGGRDQRSCPGNNSDIGAATAPGRSLKPHSDGGHHPVNGGVVLTGILGVEDQPINRPVLDVLYG
jgi:hypothetical protein